jgi:1,4-dihydroxy-2-naphthoate octaprenyltransferase
MRLSRRQISLFIRLSRPHFLLGGLLLYALGVSIASYLGNPVNFVVYFLGQGIVISIQLMTHYLNEYYDAHTDQVNENRTLFSGGSGALGPDGLPRATALYAGIGAMTLAATFTGILLTVNTAPLLAWLILILAFVGAYSYSAPPLKLIHSAYGELLASFVVAGLLPAFAFSLQTGELHRLIFMTSIPLIALQLRHDHRL